MAENKLGARATEFKVILGIDFGTTFSGVAWADNERKEVQTIQKWPGKAEDVEKVPSEICYLADGTFKWGYEVHRLRPGVARVERYVKLLLDETQSTKAMNGNDPLGLREARALLPAGKRPVDVVVDYLTALKKHALEVLESNYAQKWWESIDVEYHLTVPAVWADAAKDLTSEAASRAGMGSKKSVLLIAEPEAAAHHCLTALRVLQKGDVFLVADCGGGTVDLVTYKVLNLTPFEVKELAVGGEVCGSIFINREFERFMERRLGTPAFNELKRKGRPYIQMMRYFESTVKRSFRLGDSGPIGCQLPGVPDDPEKNIMDGFLELEPEEMKEIFDPVIGQVWQLIERQIESVDGKREGQVSTLLLVGGMGSSEYVKQRLEQYLTRRWQHRKINICQPTSAWSAVARGAVVCGLNRVQIRSRQARFNYGVKCRRKWEFGDPQKYKVWDPLQEEFRCDNHIEWYIKQGDEVSEREQKELDFYFCAAEREEDLEVTIVLLSSNTAPSAIETDATAPTVRRVISLNVDFESIKSRLMKKTNTNGQRYYHVEYKVAMRFHSAQILFFLLYEGKEYGNIVSATFL